MKNMILVFAICTLAILATGCMSVGAGVADSTTPLEGRSYTEIGEAEGSAWGIMVLCFPLSESRMTQKAIERALESSGGDALIEVCLDNTQYTLGPVVIVRTRVMGKAIKFKP